MSLANLKKIEREMIEHIQAQLLTGLSFDLMVFLLINFTTGFVSVDVFSSLPIVVNICQH